MKYEAYKNTPPRGWPEHRCWEVYENNGTEDGRLVAQGLVEDDCKRIVALLNASEEEE